MKFTIDTHTKTIILLEAVTKEELDKIFKSVNMLGAKKEGIWQVTSAESVQYIPQYVPPVFPWLWQYPIVVNDTPVNPIVGPFSNDNSGTWNKGVGGLTFTDQGESNFTIEGNDFELTEKTPTKSL